jgi:chemotaxis protein methyltransferase CheR
MIAAETLPASPRWDLKILATDIDSDVICAAAEGIYPLDRMSSVSPERLKRFFHKGSGDNLGAAVAKPDLKALITFRTLNLLHNWPMKGPFDVIFCRNVMIYFDQVTRERLVNRFSELLAPGGYLCIGHSESIHAGSAPFKLVGKTIYRRNGGANAG